MTLLPGSSYIIEYLCLEIFLSRRLACVVYASKYRSAVSGVVFEVYYRHASFFKLLEHLCLSNARMAVENCKCKVIPEIFKGGYYVVPVVLVAAFELYRSQAAAVHKVHYRAASHAASEAVYYYILVLFAQAFYLCEYLLQLWRNELKPCLYCVFLTLVFVQRANYGSFLIVQYGYVYRSIYMVRLKFLRAPHIYEYSAFEFQCL